MQMWSLPLSGGSFGRLREAKEKQSKKDTAALSLSPPISGSTGAAHFSKCSMNVVDHAVVCRVELLYVI